MNPYEPPEYNERDKYEPPVVDMTGMMITFTVFILLPIVTAYVASLCMD